MASTIRIKIDGTRYRLPKEDDIRSAKDFILRRNEMARALASRVDDILDDMAERIVTICYRYDVDPETFTISTRYNEDMMAEISEVMDDVEERILNLLNEYSTRVTDDKDRIARLLAWMAVLGRGNKNLRDTLDGYLYKTMKDFEAAIAALRALKVTMAQAVIRLKMYKHAIYVMPEVLAAFKHNRDFAAQYIQSLGVQHGAVGISNNGSTNVTNMAKTTLQMVWMKSLGMDYEKDGAVGYYVLRGSTYPCAKCDSMVGFHDIKDKEGFPMYHANCCCYAIPIFLLDENTIDNPQ